MKKKKLKQQWFKLREGSPEDRCIMTTTLNINSGQ